MTEGMDLAYVASNVTITVGYFALALLMLDIRSRFRDVFSTASAYTAALFLSTCAGTHIELVLHAAPDVGKVAESAHAVWLHIVQAVAVVLMVTFLMRDSLRWSLRAP